MGLLDYLNSSKSEELMANFKIKEDSPEDDYWWIDEQEEKKILVPLNDFYNQCLHSFIKVANDESIPIGSIKPIKELKIISEKVVSSFLHDKYLVHRRESDPDIFYDYMVQLAIESGMVIAKKWNNSPNDIDNYTNKVINETPLEDVRSIYKNQLGFFGELDGANFCSKVAMEWYELLKYYYKTNEFEEYTIQALIAAFDLGATIYFETLK